MVETNQTKSEHEFGSHCLLEYRHNLSMAPSSLAHTVRCIRFGHVCAHIETRHSQRWKARCKLKQAVFVPILWDVDSYMTFDGQHVKQNHIFFRLSSFVRTWAQRWPRPRAYFELGRNKCGVNSLCMRWDRSMEHGRSWCFLAWSFSISTCFVMMHVVSRYEHSFCYPRWFRATGFYAHNPRRRIIRLFLREWRDILPWTYMTRCMGSKVCLIW